MLKLKARLDVDSFLHSNKRKQNTKLILTVTLSIFLSLFMSVIIAAIAGNNPWELISGLFVNAAYDPKTLIINISIFIIAGLSFIFAYKVGLFNIGITGQMLTAGITCLSIATLIGNNFPQGLSQMFMLLIAIISSMAIGMITILLKVYLNVNEVISSILLNWIIFFLVRLIILEHLSPSGVEVSQSIPFPPTFALSIPGTKAWYSGGWIPAILISIILVAVVTVILKFTVFGKKVISVGSSFTASKYLGMNTKAILFSSMAISSAIAGILGYVLYASKSTPVIPVAIGADSLPIEGMNGIAIGLISLCNPIATIPVAFVLGWVQTSASLLVSIPSTIIDLITGFVILGAAIFTIFLKFKPWIWLNQWIVCKNYLKNYQKFNNDFDTLSSKYYSMNTELNAYIKSLKLSNKLIALNAELNLLKQSSELNAKRIQKLQNKIVSYEEFIKQASSAIDTWKLGISANEIKLMIKENLNNFTNLLYSKYIYELQEIKAQFKKHNLIDKASQYFWIEFAQEKEKNLTIDEIRLDKIKKIKKIEDKIYQLDVELLQRKQQEINFVYDSIELYKINLDEQQEKQAQENLTHFVEFKKQKIVEYETKMQERIKKIELKFDQKHKRNLEQIPGLRAKIKEIETQYNELEKKFVQEYTQKTINKKIRKDKLEKVYKESLKQANHIMLNNDEKQLLFKWIEDSYQHALRKGEIA